MELNRSNNCADCSVLRHKREVRADAEQEMDTYSAALDTLGAHPLATTRQKNRIADDVEALAAKLGIRATELSDMIGGSLGSRFFEAREDVNYAEAEIKHVRDVCAGRGLQEAAVASAALQRTRAVMVCPHTFCKRPDCTDAYDQDGILIEPATTD